MYQDLSEEEKTESVSMLMKNVEIFMRKSKTKSVNFVANDIKIYLKINNKVLLSIEENVPECIKIKSDQ